MMQFDFAALLVIAALVTGSIWVLDILVLSPRRAARSLDFAKPGGRGGGKAMGAPKLPWYVDFSRSFFPVILAVLVLRSFVVEPFRIPSGSMEPTLLPGDFILVNKFSFGIRLPVINTKIIDLGEPHRGDVTVFRYPEDPSVAFIKRIVGLPGDRVEYRNKQLFVNGDPIEQTVLTDVENEKPAYDQVQEQLDDATYSTYIRKGQSAPSWEYVVPPDHYFTMGDNRDNSRDSRFWGPLPEENLIGKAFFIWMNWDCVTGNGHCNRIGRSIK